MNMKKIAIVLTLLFFTLGGFSQNKDAGLDKRWAAMLEKSENYQLYKVIKKTELTEVWQQVQDSLQGLRRQLVEERGKIGKHTGNIASLQKELKEVNEKLEAISKEKDSISFLGMQINKNSYSSFLWVIIFLILGGAALLFFLFLNSNKVTVQSKASYDSLFSQFEEYKAVKIEVERKLRRELQTQMNTIEELKRNGRV